MKTLTPEQRAVVVLREVEGLSYEEIAKTLECATGTVMSRLHYARKRLQALLREHHEG
jgi:RNA polymerase sigma-70 factor (ECF subfamily)